jgi:hypothetical protein
LPEPISKKFTQRLKALTKPTCVNSVQNNRGLHEVSAVLCIPTNF